ncbi:hypothetical protein HPB48_019792 [Haemaphysalis longicornis]|uniref:Uncharacterized protein n=1 Tax=Haemaphysalis longicornis TaxID=44386 RepID=A0A9J6GDS0_HAELO|nr:hypothetical protein HPB48_019792 [Haemaphysalis longicornis]
MTLALFVNLSSSSGGPRPALAQVKELAQADVHTSWSLSQTTSLGLTSRHKKPRGGDVAQTNDPSAIDAEATAPPNQTTTSLTPSSRLRKSRDRKKTKPVEMTEAEPAPSAVSDPLVKQNLRDAVPPSRRPVVTPSTQPLPKSPTVQEQQRPETAVASNSRGQTAVTPAAAVPASAVTNDRFNDATPPAPGTLRASSLPPDAVVDPLPPEPTPAAPAVPAVFGEDASRIATPPAREGVPHRFHHCRDGLIVLILVLPLGGRQDIDDVDDAGVCATPDCIRHAHVLGLLNRSEDGDSVPGPCDDFGKFVCSAARNRYGRLAADVVSQMILNWAASLMYEAPALSPKLDNFSKPAAMIQACTLCKGCGEASAKALVEFVANRTFGWPTVGDDHEGNPSRRYDSAVTLQALVELSVEWALPLWFRLELSTPSHLHGRRVFYILPSPMPSLWDGFHRDLLSVGDTYATYLGLFNDTILSMRKPPQHYSTFLTERSKDFQLEIFETLRETTEAAEPLFVELGQLHPILRNVRAGDWYRILQSVYNVSPPVSQRDLVFLSNGRLLTAIGNLFSTRTPTDIFYHTTWWFLQAMGPFASDAVFSFLNANPTGKLFLQTMCGVQLESSYYDSLAAVNKAKIPGDQRLAISIYLRNVRTVAAERIRSFDSINNTARDSLSNTLEKTVDFIWPEKDVEELERYHGWPNASLGDYFSQWISRSPHVHDSSNGSAPLDSRSKVYRLDGRHVTSYDPLSNVISVSVAALLFTAVLLQWHQRHDLRRFRVHLCHGSS